MVCGSEPGERETRARGYFVCEDVGLEHAIEADEEKLSLRSERMYEGVEDLYAWFPILDNEDLVERCRALLSQDLCALRIRLFPSLSIFRSVG